MKEVKMVTEKKEDFQQSDNKTSDELSKEVSDAVEELKAAQAKLEVAKASLEAKQKSNDTSGIAGGNSSSAPVELEAEPVVVENSNPQPGQEQNWAPYTPPAEPVAGTVPPEAGVPVGTPVVPPDAAYQANNQEASSSYYASTGNAEQPASPYTAQQQQYQQPYAQPVVSSKDHIAAGLLGIFLGSLGIHKFYMGYNTAGFIMLVVTILGSVLTLGIAGGVVWIIGIIEGIIYLTKTQSEFEQTYVFNKREWF